MQLHVVGGDAPVALGEGIVHEGGEGPVDVKSRVGIAVVLFEGSAVCLIGGDGHVRLLRLCGAVGDDALGPVGKGHVALGAVFIELRIFDRLVFLFRLFRLRLLRLRDGRAGRRELVPFQNAALAAEIFRILLARDAARGVVEVRAFVEDAVVDVAAVRGLGHRLFGGRLLRRLLLRGLGPVGIEDVVPVLEQFLLLQLARALFLFPLAAGVAAHLALALHAESAIAGVKAARAPLLRLPLLTLLPLRRVIGGGVLPPAAVVDEVHVRFRLPALVRGEGHPLLRLRGLFESALPFELRLPESALAFKLRLRLRLLRRGCRTLLGLRGLFAAAGLARRVDGAALAAGRAAAHRDEQVHHPHDEKGEDDIAADVGGQPYDGIDGDGRDRAARRGAGKAVFARAEAGLEVVPEAVIGDAVHRRRGGMRQAEGEQRRQHDQKRRLEARMDVLARDEGDGGVDEEREHGKGAVAEHAQQKCAHCPAHFAEDGVLRDQKYERDDGKQRQYHPHRFAGDYARFLGSVLTVFSLVAQNISPIAGSRPRTFCRSYYTIFPPAFQLNGRLFLKIMRAPRRGLFPLPYIGPIWRPSRALPYRKSPTKIKAPRPSLQKSPHKDKSPAARRKPCGGAEHLPCSIVTCLPRRCSRNTSCAALCRLLPAGEKPPWRAWR